MNTDGVWYVGFRAGDDRGAVVKHVDDCPAQFIRLPAEAELPRREGFDWGTGSRGETLLAFALCADVLGVEHADAVCHKFRLGVVSRFPHKGFRITADAIEEWARVLDETRRVPPFPRQGVVLFDEEATPGVPGPGDEEA